MVEILCQAVDNQFNKKFTVHIVFNYTKFTTKLLWAIYRLVTIIIHYPLSILLYFI
jgi:hypothetical protein